ncbi:hypothetical protein HZF05_15630 [Sphingomonas sp. CGMCC 1.13654]|uniref:Uncharacterized protein n=1 Tax=Sphingomonas chungangi TaxID=2683589 RepID=A0A838L913_9SPHN|nr:hypothetical protein [Sphingomonas chungangi]MBA2935517.1 hypothetical protein [Sphingomonas chungangi]MVW57024.1 hypothetical protein [Sphingomonas chungangi]
MERSIAWPPPTDEARLRYRRARNLSVNQFAASEERAEAAVMARQREWKFARPVRS